MIKEIVMWFFEKSTKSLYSIIQKENPSVKKKNVVDWITTHVRTILKD